ncbi:hypothetical protein ACKWNL_24155, partial [Escherichia coli]
VTFFCISDTLVPTTYLVDTTLSNSSDSDQTVQAVRLRLLGKVELLKDAVVYGQSRKWITYTPLLPTDKE